MLKTTLQTFGACDGEVTGSKHLLKIGDKKFFIDYGYWQGTSELEALNKTFECPIKPDELDGIFLTHAHLDHCGLIPTLVRDGFDKKIWCTPATRDLASLIMMDCAKISDTYTNTDVVKTLGQFRCHFYGKVKKISDDITFTFYDAGHILGSSLVDIAVKKDKSFFQKLFKKDNEFEHILFTGDLGRDSNPITWAPEKKVPAPEVIVMESTYGDRTHSNRDFSIDQFKIAINETLKRKGRVIIPAFAIERTQEVILLLKTLMQEKKIPRVPVYLDSPMATNATGIFSIHLECLNQNLVDNFLSKNKNPFSIDSLKIVKDGKSSDKLARSKESCIIISANGMCEAGRITKHLKSALPNPKNTIILVGYTGANTVGRKIEELEPRIKLQDGAYYDLKCQVEKIDSFSSHSDYKESLNWLSQIDTSKLKQIILVHGQKESQENLKKVIEEAYPKVKVTIAQSGEIYNM